ncbi:MAG: LytTR family transcriptional regulator DNA-binding domain-containing protein [Saprospiraceae bacterium]|nr:LytTR family transcriptional regulator DNA-binding domain-containing protein [Saprospiraceae bacterium]
MSINEKKNEIQVIDNIDGTCQLKFKCLGGKQRDIDVEKIIYGTSYFGCIKLIVSILDTDNKQESEEIYAECSLTHMEFMLKGYNFIRVHRSFLINLFYLMDYGFYPSDIIHLGIWRPKNPIKLSRQKKLLLHNKYKSYKTNR